MKEKFLVLGKACPIVSKKYEHLVCVAGITDKGKWRRIYPVPWESFWKNSLNKFSKKCWIEYGLKSSEPSDKRPESRKILFETIKQLNKEKWENIKKILDSKLTNLEYLNNKKAIEISLGVIKPEIIDFYAEDNPHHEKNINKKKQMDLSMKSVVKIDSNKKAFKYKFRCFPNFKDIHDMRIESWELTELYRKCKKSQEQGKTGYETEDKVIEKVKQRFMNLNDVYFIVGTDYRYDKYLIIDVIYSGWHK